MAEKVKSKSEKTGIIREHVPVTSFAVASDLYGKLAHYFSRKPVQLVNTMSRAFDRGSKKAARMMLEKMQPLLDALKHGGHSKKSGVYKRVAEYRTACQLLVSTTHNRITIH